MAHRTAVWARRSGRFLEISQAGIAFRSLLSASCNLEQRRHKGQVKVFKDHFRKLKAPERYHGPALSKEEAFIHSLGQSSSGRLGPAVVHFNEDGLAVIGPLKPHREHKTRYVYMDDDEVDNYLNEVRRVFEQPIVEEDVPELPASKVIETNTEAANPRFDFVFVDVNKDKTNIDREIRIRQKDGVLRTASPAEREKYTAQFFSTTYKRKAAPGLCQEPMLSAALEENQHRIVLDLTVKTLLNYQADYQRVHQTVFEDIEKRRIYSVVQDTTHWVRFFQWLMKTDQVDGVLTMLLSAGRLEDAAKLSILRSKGTVPAKVAAGELALLGEFVEGRVSDLNKTLFTKAIKQSKSQL